jgi:hypothetical protein
MSATCAFTGAEGLCTVTSVISILGKRRRRSSATTAAVSIRLKACSVKVMARRLDQRGIVDAVVEPVGAERFANPDCRDQVEEEVPAERAFLRIDAMTRVEASRATRKTTLGHEGQYSFDRSMTRAACTAS